MNAAIESRWRRAVAEARDLNRQRQARVLAHPDLAARLCEPPLNYTEPKHWNGFIPPRYLPEDEQGRSRPNDSPRRAALIDIAAEAMRREGGQDA